MNAEIGTFVCGGNRDLGYTDIDSVPALVWFVVP
jgi:hypothetical protein